MFLSAVVPTVVSSSTYMMYAFPTRFMVCMMYTFLNSPFKTGRIKLRKKYIYSAPFHTS